MFLLVALIMIMPFAAIALGSLLIRDPDDDSILSLND